MSDGGNGAIWAAVTAGVLAILGSAIGSVFQGQANVELEKAQRETRLILKALEPEDEEQRRETLRFMVTAKLISDAELIDGLSTYTREDAPWALPQVRTSQATASAFVPRSEADTGQADADLFLCGKRQNDDKAIELRATLAQNMIESGRFGHIAKKVWEGPLYNEIAASELAGKISIVVDTEHPEAALAPQIASLVKKANSRVKSVQIANRGSTSPWRISVVICP